MYFQKKKLYKPQKFMLGQEYNFYSITILSAFLLDEA